MKLLLAFPLLILFCMSGMAQENPVIPCSVKEGKTATTLTCRDGKRRVIPRTAYRFIGCKTVNLRRGVDGKMGFAEQQSCHVIDSALMIRECKKWQESQKSYDLARNTNSVYLPDCEQWWANVEGEQALVTVYQMRPTPKTNRELEDEGWNANLDGSTLQQNPYSEDPDLRLRKHWRIGWLQAQRRLGR